MSASSISGSNSSSASTASRMSLVVPIAVRPFLSGSERRDAPRQLPGRAGPGPAAPGPGRCLFVRSAALAQYPYPPPDDAFPDWLLVTGSPDPLRTYQVPPKLVSAWPLATPGPESPEKVYSRQWL